MWVSLGEQGAALAGGARGAAMLVLREALQDARDYAANRAAFERNERRDYALSRLDLEALVPVVEGRLPVVVSVERASDILAALRLRDEFGLRMILTGAAEGWMVADDIARADVPVVVYPFQNIPAFERLGTTFENAARLHAAGVRVVIGTGGLDASVSAHNSRNLRHAAGVAAAHGLPWEAALAAITTTPAEVWGVSDHYGRVAPGQDADLVVWSGDPLELTTLVRHVLVRGREVDLAATRQRALFERYREREALPQAYDHP
jgi:imidazolonepropionase-like amidohydrolase